MWVHVKWKQIYHFQLLTQNPFLPTLLTTLQRLAIQQPVFAARERNTSVHLAGLLPVWRNLVELSLVYI
jgi:hypothetical protein